MRHAAIRPGDWELPLLVHVGGAMLLVGSLVAVLAIAVAARRGAGDAAGLPRLAFRVLLLGVLPSWVVMRVGAQWVESKEDWGDTGWIGLGYATSEAGLLLILIALFVTRRAPARAGTTVAALSAVLLLAYTVTVWAMTTKPG
jgi:hypothetical protein